MIYFKQNLNLIIFQKFLSIFERLGIKRKNKIGFSCGKLFIINYFRGLEVFQYFHNKINLTFIILSLGYYNVHSPPIQDYQDRNQEKRKYHILIQFNLTWQKCCSFFNVIVMCALILLNSYVMEVHNQSAISGMSE